jgi:hypothetical protein
MKVVLHAFKAPLAILTAVALFAACSKDGATDPDTQIDEAVFALRNASTRYLDLDSAKADGFVFLHGCETRPNEGPVGIVYVNPNRLDATIDPANPDALIYAPGNPKPTLVAVEFAVPFTAWNQSTPPSYLGNAFQREDEFGVFGLHVWVWRTNPKGLFAESNPNVNC